MAKRQSPLRQAIDELYRLEAGSGLATPKQLLETAEKYDLAVWALEGSCLEEAAMLAEE